MKGLTEILTKIQNDNSKACEDILLSSQQKADGILEQAKKDVDEIEKAAKLKLDEKLAAEKSKAMSGAELEYKRVLLAEKCKIIDSFLDDAVKAICESEDSEYFGYMKTLVLKHALCGNGSICFNKKDAQRLPSGFVDEVNSALGDGKSVSLDSANIDTCGGFIINYPEMRVDCTLDSLVLDKADEIKDSLNKVLFA